MGGQVRLASGRAALPAGRRNRAVGSLTAAGTAGTQAVRKALGRGSDRTDQHG